VLCPEGEGEDLAPLGEDLGGEGERPIGSGRRLYRGMRGYRVER
jgi:hypothetical protein